MIFDGRVLLHPPQAHGVLGAAGHAGHRDILQKLAVHHRLRQPSGGGADLLRQYRPVRPAARLEKFVDEAVLLPQRIAAGKGCFYEPQGQYFLRLSLAGKAEGLRRLVNAFQQQPRKQGNIRQGHAKKAHAHAGGAGQGHIAPPGSGRGLPEGPQVPPALPLVRQVFADHEVLLPLFRAARLPDDGVSLLKHHLKGLHKGPVERLPQGRRDLFIQLPVQGRLRRRPVALQKPLLPLPHLAVRLGPGGLPP